MNSELQRPGRKFRRTGINATARPKTGIDHAEIVRMATAESLSRAAERRDTIATAAYFRAQQRGFEPGHELDDWLAAEAEVAHALQLSILVTGADTP